MHRAPFGAVRPVNGNAWETLLIMREYSPKSRVFGLEGVLSFSGNCLPNQNRFL